MYSATIKKNYTHKFKNTRKHEECLKTCVNSDFLKRNIPHNCDPFFKQNFRNFITSESIQTIEDLELFSRKKII